MKLLSLIKSDNSIKYDRVQGELKADASMLDISTWV